MKTTLMRITLMLAAVVMMAACSKDNDGVRPSQGNGEIEFVCTVDADVDDVVTRATSGYQLPAELIPSGNAIKTALTLKITGEYDDPKTKGVVDMVAYNNSWATLKAYEEEEVKLNQGSYSAELENKPRRDENGLVLEGEANPYFRGGAYGNVLTVTAGLTTQANITLSMVNSCFTLKVTEWLMKYYSDVTLTIHSATNSWEYKPTTSSFASPLIFVNAGQKLRLSGKATKQNGIEVEFPEAEIPTELKADTHYNIVVDHATAGGAGITINLGDNYTEIEEVEIDLRESTI